MALSSTSQILLKRVPHRMIASKTSTSGNDSDAATVSVLAENDNTSVESENASKLLHQMQTEIEMALHRSSDQFLKDVFTRHASAIESIITPSATQGALHELGVAITAEEVPALVLEADVDGRGGLDLDALARIVKQRSADRQPLEQWAETLPLPSVIACSLRAAAGFDHANAPQSAPVHSSGEPGSDQLRAVSRLGRLQLDVVAAAVGRWLRLRLTDELERLRQQHAALDARAQLKAGGSGAKFMTVKMSAGDVGDYHAGLRERVGGWPRPRPLLRRGLRRSLLCPLAPRLLSSRPPQHPGGLFADPRPLAPALAARAAARAAGSERARGPMRRARDSGEPRPRRALSCACGGCRAA